MILIILGDHQVIPDPPKGKGGGVLGVMALGLSLSANCTGPGTWVHGQGAILVLCQHGAGPLW